MHNHIGVLIAQLKIFSVHIGNEHEAAIRFSGLGDSLFFPVAGRELKGNNYELFVFYGELESGEAAWVILDSNPFPFALVAVRKPDDKPRREFGFGQPLAAGGVQPPPT